MNEKKIYQEIPGGKNSFHSAVLTSFSFHFQHFENQVLRSLKQKWITSINVLVDQSMLDEALGLASGNLKTIGQTYSINGISVQGAFHPKLNIFLGDEKILVVFGSGNISPGGHGKNHELFTGFYADSKNQHHLPIILETWDYLKTICKHLEGYSAERINRVLPRACSLIKSFDLPKHKYHNLTKGVDVALLYNDKQSIAQQLLANIPSKEITKITIVCPYYDSDGRTLKLLLSKCPNATIEVYMQNQFGLPPIEMKPSTKIKFYDFDVTHRGRGEISGKNEYVRKLHCKLFHFRSSSMQYCLIGSANSTSQGIGTLDIKGANEEFGALYKSKNIDFLREFGIYGRKKEINIYSLKRLLEVTDDKAYKESQVRVRINSIDLNGNYLKVFLYKKYDLSTLSLGAFDLDGEICFKLPIQNHTESSLGFRLLKDQIGKDPKYCAFLNDKEVIISNKQLINNLHKLINTNPSKESRAIRQIISTIEGGGYNEFEIVDFLNQLNLEKPKEIRRNLTHGNSDQKEEYNFDEASILTYEEAVMKAKDSKETVKILNVNPTSRLWQSIEQIFENKNIVISEEQMDEEEEGSPNTSRRRIVEEKENPKIPLKSKKYAWAQLGSIEKIVVSYINSIKRLKSNEKHNLDIIDYHQFLLVSYILTSVCYFAEYSLPNEILEKDWRDKLDTMYKKLMIDVLKEFALLHFKKSITTHDPIDEELVNRQKDAIQKTLYHLFLNLTFILRKKSHPILEDEMRLIVFNLYQKLGLPDNRVTSYFENMLKMYQHTTISINQINRTKDFFANSFKDASLGFIKTSLLGYCKILEHRDHRYKVKSLFGIHFIDENKMKAISDHISPNKTN